jgi:hypothetical protein
LRIKFEKGFTPERIGEIFAQIIQDDEIVIGAVNVYIQTYDDEMKPVPFHIEEGDYILVKPSNKIKQEYADDVINKRRGKLKLVSG